MVWSLTTSWAPPCPCPAPPPPGSTTTTPPGASTTQRWGSTSKRTFLAEISAKVWGGLIVQYFLIFSKKCYFFKWKTVYKLVFFKWGNPPLWPCYSVTFQKVSYPISAGLDFFLLQNKIGQTQIQRLSTKIHSRPKTGRPVNHGRVFLVPSKKWLVQCTLLYMCTLDKSLLSRYQKKKTFIFNRSPCKFSK